MDDKAVQARREYYRRWRQNNKDKVRNAQERYWLRRAEHKREIEHRLSVTADPVERSQLAQEYAALGGSQNIE